ncbi:MAG TPA: HAD family phosphatase [Bacteroidota bacterium]
MIKAILWDNDGILVDTERLYFRATQQTLATVGVHLTEEMYQDLFLVKAKGAWHLAEAKGIPKEDLDRLRADRGRLYLSMLEKGVKSIEGVEEVLRTLHGKYFMGVVTSSHREHFEAIHRSTGLMKYFSFALTSEDYEKFKPDPEPYLMAIRKSGFSANECVAIEDSERGLTSATGAGLRCFVIPTAMTRSQKFKGAYKILQSVREIPSAIASIG